MEDKMQEFFSTNNFDIEEPNFGHEMRFEQKLNKKKNRSSLPWKWMSVAASVVLVFGFWLGSNHEKSKIQLADISPKMEEVENYFVNTIRLELKTVEKNRSLETETIIEEALNEIEELEETFQLFVKELNKEGNNRKVISAMIQNYQQRIEILENVLEQIELIKNPKIISNEIYI